VLQDLDRLEEWAYANLMKFKKDKFNILHLGWGNPQYQYRLGDEGIESKGEGLGDTGEWKNWM